MCAVVIVTDCPYVSSSDGQQEHWSSRNTVLVTSGHHSSSVSKLSETSRWSLARGCSHLDTWVYCLLTFLPSVSPVNGLTLVTNERPVFKSRDPTLTNQKPAPAWRRESVSPVNNFNQIHYQHKSVINCRGFYIFSSNS